MSSTGYQTPSRTALDWLEAGLFELFKPPPRLTPSEWADQHRMLSRESSAMPGKYRTSVAPYQTEPLDSVLDPDVQSTTLLWGSQVGKTEILNNLVGFFAQCEPSPILMIQPTVDMAKNWSRKRLGPMLRDTLSLRKITAPSRTRDSGNNLLSKEFRSGGSIFIAGANAPAGLAGNPIRVVFLDEVDRYPESAGAEGDPCSLAERRTESFWNAVLFRTSTPTNKGSSRIEKFYEGTDKRQWFVACPECGFEQVLNWRQIKWPKDQPEEAWLECEGCQAQLEDKQRVTMVREGVWKPTAEFRGRRGYWLNGINSPFRHKKGYRNRLHQMVVDFLNAKHDGRLTLKTWTNTFLAECWEEEADRIEASELLRRREDYGSGDLIPEGVLVITAGVDVQADRLELEVVGWGVGEESWGLGYIVIPGNTLLTGPWDELDQILTGYHYKHPVYGSLRIARMAVDSGDWADVVYSWTKPRFGLGAIAIKGANTPFAAILASLTVVKPSRAKLVRIGTGTAKDAIYTRLKQLEPGPGSMHFTREESAGYDDHFFDMLTSEELRTTYQKGFKKKEWFVIGGKRNEALDCRVYAFAALKLLKINWARLKAKLDGRTSTEEEEKQQQPMRKRPRFAFRKF